MSKSPKPTQRALIAEEIARQLAPLEERLAADLAAQVQPLAAVLEKISIELEAMKASGAGFPGPPVEDPSAAIHAQMAKFAAEKLRMKETLVQARLNQLQSKGV